MNDWKTNAAAGVSMSCTFWGAYSSCSLTCTNTYLLQPKTRRCQTATGPRSWSKPAGEPCLGWGVLSSDTNRTKSYWWGVNKSKRLIFVGAQAAEEWMGSQRRQSLWLKSANGNMSVTQPLIPQVLHAKCPLSGADRAAPSSWPVLGELQVPD